MPMFPQGAHGQQQELARWQSVDQSTDLTGAVYITTAGDCKVVCTGPIGDRTVRTPSVPHVPADRTCANVSERR
jgi:hypothetical protein